jgi:hypothetical protein
MSIVDVGCLVGRKINIEAELLKKMLLYCDLFYVVSPDNVRADPHGFIILGIKFMSSEHRRHKFNPLLR